MSWQTIIGALLILAVGGAFIYVQHNGVRVGVEKAENTQLKVEKQSEKATNDAQNKLRKVETSADADLDRLLAWWMRP